MRILQEAVGRFRLDYYESYKAYMERVGVAKLSPEARRRSDEIMARIKEAGRRAADKPPIRN